MDSLSLLKFSQGCGDHESLGNIELWNEIHKEGLPRSYKKGEAFDAIWDCPYDLFFLEKGHVEIEYISLGGLKRPLLTHGPGAVFNMGAAILKRKMRERIVLLDDSRVWIVPGGVLHEKEKISTCPYIVICAMENYARIVDVYREILTDLTVGCFLGCFCRYLVKRLDQDGCFLGLDITQNELAASFGVHRATLSRAVHYLKNEKIIGEFSRKKISILDVAALRRIAAD